MYNEKIKRKYLKEVYPDNSKESVVLIREFEKAAAFEEGKRKDLYDWRISEIIEYYQSLKTDSLETLETINKKIMQYVEWALKNELTYDARNHFREVNHDILAEKCLNKDIMNSKIVSREDLLEKISLLPNASDRFVLLALFEGFKGKDFCDIYNIKTTDINMTDKTVCTFSGKCKKMSDELIEIAIMSAKEYQYKGMTLKSTRMNILVGEPEDVIKSYPNMKGNNEYNKGRTIYNKIIRSIPYCGLSPNLTATAIFE